LISRSAWRAEFRREAGAAVETGYFAAKPMNPAARAMPVIAVGAVAEFLAAVLR
jgi:hypothetical protein